MFIAHTFQHTRRKAVWEKSFEAHVSISIIMISLFILLY